MRIIIIRKKILRKCKVDVVLDLVFITLRPFLKSINIDKLMLITRILKLPQLPYLSNTNLNNSITNIAYILIFIVDISNISSLNKLQQKRGIRKIAVCIFTRYKYNKSHESDIFQISKNQT